MRPPLRIVALFPDRAPASLASDQTMSFVVERVKPPFEPLKAHAADAGQPMELVDRIAALQSRSALCFTCSTDVAPFERLPAAIDLLEQLLAAGASAVVLPAAYKLVGRAALRALLDQLDTVDGWTALFVHHYVQVGPGWSWHHTHGMEHFGYPDLECWTAEPDVAVEAVVRGAIRHLIAQGADALRVGDQLNAVADDGRDGPVVRVCEPRPVADHELGAYGVLGLALE